MRGDALLLEEMAGRLAHQFCANTGEVNARPLNEIAQEIAAAAPAGDISTGRATYSAYLAAKVAVEIELRGFDVGPLLVELAELVEVE